MSEFVVGEWKQFVFKMVTPDTYPLVLKALRKSFYPDEAVLKLVGYTDELGDQIDEMVLYYLSKDKGLSFYAEEKATGKIAGVRVTHPKGKGDPEPKIEFTDPKLLTILSIMDEVSKNANVFDKYGVDNIAYLFMTSVDQEFRGQGLVTEIYKRSIAMLRAKNYPVCSSIFSSPFTRRAATNLKFEQLYYKRFLDFKDENGVQVLPNATPDQGWSVMALPLL